MRRFLRNNGLSITLVSSFLAIWLGGQTTAGLHKYNAEQVEDGESTGVVPPLSRTSHFGEATFENWESEFLQMGCVRRPHGVAPQRGRQSRSRSRATRPRRGSRPSTATIPDAPWPVAGRTWLASTALAGLAFLALFLASFLLHAGTGSRVFNAEQALRDRRTRVTTWKYLCRSEFWFESLQNWQSEFLAVPRSCS